MKYASICYALIVIILSGCEGNPDKVKSYVAGVKARDPAPLDALPALHLEAPFFYSAHDLRSPFEPAEKDSYLIGSEDRIAPRTDRVRETLEAFPLDAIRMVGTIEKKKEKWAIFIDRDSLIYRAGIGNYVGKNHGKIVDITERSVRLKEIVPSERGGWMEKETDIALVTQ